MWKSCAGFVPYTFTYWFSFNAIECNFIYLFGCSAWFDAVSGVFLAERINTFLGQNWKSFSSQNYFDPQGLFISVVWSGPLLLITILILVITFLWSFLCILFFICFITSDLFSPCFVGEHSCDALHADRKVEKGRAQASRSPGSEQAGLILTCIYVLWWPVRKLLACYNWSNQEPCSRKDVHLDSRI